MWRAHPGFFEKVLFDYIFDNYLYLEDEQPLKDFKDMISELFYRRAISKYLDKLPTLSKYENFIVKALKQQGVFVTSLNKLTTYSTSLMLQSANHLMLELQKMSPSDSIDYVLTTDHSMHIFSTHIVWNHSELFLWGLEESILRIVETYIGLPITYFGVGLRKEIVNGEEVGTRIWHFDREDRRVVKVIIYLNDVSEQDGPFEYIPKHLTVSNSILRQFLKFVPKFINLPNPALKYIPNPVFDKDLRQIISASEWKQCLGSAGTVIFVDTANVWHHGKIPHSERVTATFTYTSRKPRAARYYKQIGEPNIYRNGLVKISKNLTKNQRDCLTFFIDGNEWY